MRDSTVVSMIISSKLVSVMVSGIPAITSILIMITNMVYNLWRVAKYV